MILIGDFRFKKDSIIGYVVANDKKNLSVNIFTCYSNLDKVTIHFNTVDERDKCISDLDKEFLS